MQNFTTLTLGELLTSTNETIKRNSLSILKTLQRNAKYNCDGRHENVKAIIACPDCAKDIDEM